MKSTLLTISVNSLSPRQRPIRQAGAMIPLFFLLMQGAVNQAQGALLVADFQFNNTLNSSVGSASLNFPAAGFAFATNPGSLTWGTGEVSFPTRTGFEVDVSGILAGYYTDYTVAIMVKIPDPNSWRGLSYASPNIRLSGDDGFQVQPSGKMSLWTNNNNYTVGSNGDIIANTYFQASYSLSFSAGTYTLISDLQGVNDRSATFTTTNLPEAFVINGTDPRLAFFRDNYQDLTQGTVDRIQIYAGAMNAVEMAALDLTIIPEPSTNALIGGLAVLGAVMLRRRRKV